mmetsp:Transcript_6447/g.24169  ORF Transcript_6447/g.24169 Transcript_6447/m.24169 type:complete len:105 (-) Transcript_6447:488-802(-)
MSTWVFKACVICRRSHIAASQNLLVNGTDLLELVKGICCTNRVPTPTLHLFTSHPKPRKTTPINGTTHLAPIPNPNLSLSINHSPQKASLIQFADNSVYYFETR